MDDCVSNTNVTKWLLLMFKFKIVFPMLENVFGAKHEIALFERSSFSDGKSCLLVKHSSLNF